jgi:hypothetical protein
MTFEGLREVILVSLFAVSDGGQLGQLSASELPPVAQPARPPEWAVTVMGGVLNETSFGQILFAPWTSDFVDTQLLSGTVSKRIHEFSEDSLIAPYWFLDPDWFIDWEVGAGQRFGNSKAGEFWTALYLNYDGFPWSNTVYMAFGTSIGLNYATSISDLEVRKSENGKGNKLLHYFSPEITFADPDHKDLAIVARWHHRSGVFGLIDRVKGGSTFLSIGIRKHF